MQINGEEDEKYNLLHVRSIFESSLLSFTNKRLPKRVIFNQSLICILKICWSINDQWLQNWLIASLCLLHHYKYSLYIQNTFLSKWQVSSFKTTVESVVQVYICTFIKLFSPAWHKYNTLLVGKVRRNVLIRILMLIKQ